MTEIFFWNFFILLMRKSRVPGKFKKYIGIILNFAVLNFLVIKIKEPDFQKSFCRSLPYFNTYIPWEQPLHLIPLMWALAIIVLIESKNWVHKGSFHRKDFFLSTQQSYIFMRFIGFFDSLNIISFSFQFNFYSHR